jgi:hypothetical protein
MDKLIKMSYNKSFSDSDIRRLCDNRVNVIEYEQLQHMRSIDEALGPYGAFILLYETSRNYGHWVAVILHEGRDGGILEHFDSYALKPDQELNFTPHNLRRELGQDLPHLTALMYNSPYNVIYNKVKLQKFDNGLNTCGRWCAMRVVLRDLPLKKFCSLFMKQNFTPDYYITALTMFV